MMDFDDLMKVAKVVTENPEDPDFKSSSPTGVHLARCVLTLGTEIVKLREELATLKVQP